VRRGSSRQRDWDDLPNGGKDGLFLIVVSLGWWIHVLGPSEDSKIDEAIEDVTWVIGKLVSLLAADAANPDSDSGGAGESAELKKRSKPVKIGPPSKRARRARS